MQDELEQALLGNILFDNSQFDIVSDIINADMMRPVHGRIYDKIAELVFKNKEASPLTVAPYFESDPDLEGVGGKGYFADLIANVVNPKASKDYALELQKIYKKTRLLNLSHMIKDCIERDDISELIEKDLTEINQEKTYEITAQEAVAKAMQWMRDVREGKVKPVKTGIKWLDDKIGGFFPAGFYVIAGRPGMGKTALMLNLADNVENSLIVSLEMRAEELGMRLISSRTGIDVNRQRTGQVNEVEWKAVNKAYQSLEGKKVFIQDCPTANLNYIRTIARRHIRKQGTFTLFIDYLGLVEVGKGDNRAYQIQDITRGLKSLAKELSIPVVLLSQLNRGVEAREDKRPLMSDLRDSGAIEQDADVVMFPYRHEYYLQHERPQKKSNEHESKYIGRLADWEKELSDSRGKAEIIVGKNRHGFTGSVPLSFDGQKQLFKG